MLAFTRAWLRSGRLARAKTKSARDSAIGGRNARWLRAAPIALKPASTRNVDGGAQSLSNEVTCLAVVGRIPVTGLVFQLIQSRRPASAFVRW
jgi:hypothetical protein